MSDINDLIHSNAVIAFQQGEKTEQQRIIALLPDFCRNLPKGDLAENLAALIKGEQK